MMSNLIRIAVPAAIAVLALLPAQGAGAQACNNLNGANCLPCRQFEQLIGLANSTLLGSLDPGVKSFLNLLGPDVADLDGAFLIDDTGPSLVAMLSGDDIRDVSSQLQLLHSVMVNNTPGLPFTGADLRAAYAANEATMKAKMGNDPTLMGILIVAPFVTSALTWLTLLGKSTDFSIIHSDDPIHTEGQGTLGILQALFTLLDGTEIDGKPLRFADPTVNPGDFITFGDFLTADADLDGDGYSNICEYRHFKKNLCASTFPNVAPAVNQDITFLQAVVNPDIVPEGCFRVMREEDDCRFELTPEAVVPSSKSEASGFVRVRRFENDVTHVERYQLNYFHTVQTAAPVAQFRKGAVGQQTDQVIINIPAANPIWWEYYLTSGVATLRSTPNYFSIYTNEGTLEEAIRGDNTCGIIAPPPPVPHDADTNKNFVIETAEVLAVIEYINAGRYGCGPNFTYVGGGTDESCEPHSSDYDPQDWEISLPELLRLIQLYTAGAYEDCRAAGISEDGYCPVVP